MVGIKERFLKLGIGCCQGGRTIKKYIILFLVGSLLLLATLPAAAEPLSFNADRIYWQSTYQLAVEGHFTNTGTSIITGVSSFYLAIYYLDRGDYYLLGSGTWINSPELLNIVLKPGQTSSWTFYIATASHPIFSYWIEDWKVQYNYLN
ncbi:MAG TPA: hypothetical protein VHR47_12075 [Bacillota bacterium]|nr:hypothetical protein [Bacillota bacterium]